MSTIPIRNLYYLLCYSWNKLEQGSIVHVEGVDSRRVADLLATVLIKGTNHLFRRGLDCGYRLVSCETNAPRGRINLNTTLKRSLLAANRVSCEFDEFTPNVPHNQILKTTILKLAAIEDIDKTLSAELYRLGHRFVGVDRIAHVGRSLNTVQLHGNNSFYDFLMKICRLVWYSLLPTEVEGKSKFVDFVRDERVMSRVFEDFVRNFYRLEQSEFEVRRERVEWDAKGEEQALAYLPNMTTDVSLRGNGRTIIVDAKYYQQTFQKHYDTEKYHSGNLYQLLAYLKNLEKNGGPDEQSMGILLYPRVEKRLDYSLEICGHSVRVYTLDLEEEWTQIHASLLNLLPTSSEIVIDMNAVQNTN